eukprot:TRINITY_DN225_c0_g2_i2.p2 TRINITY_DN225_c0_g2~~TRINITY_DN225_c0_g2_i2.p2  ORF type:complete len:111 (-),score=17.53 TRINITY_DN225_c0_g2_i2:1793-2125(-)
MLPIHTEESSLLQKHTLRNGRALLIFLKLVTPVVFIALAIVSILSSSGKLPISNKELTDKYQVLLSPASYAFSIWGLIYFLQVTLRSNEGVFFISCVSSGMCITLWSSSV